METAIRHLQQILLPHGGLSPAEWDLMRLHLQFVTPVANERLLNALGDIYFLFEGLILQRMDDTPQHFIQANDLIFIPRERTFLQLKALTDCRLLLLERRALYAILETSPRLISLYDRLHENWNIQSQQRLRYLTQSKIDRIQSFTQEQKAVLPYISRREIAQYLCVSEEYLRKHF